VCECVLGNVDCLPGTQVPRGFYLVEFELNYSLTLESEKDTRSPTGKLTSWLTSLSAVLQKLVCAVRDFASWQIQQRQLGSPYGGSTSHAPGRKNFRGPSGENHGDKFDLALAAGSPSTAISATWSQSTRRCARTAIYYSVW
jgi:hypothetical protein